MTPDGTERASEPDGYAVILDDPKGDTPGGCGYWYVGAYRAEVVAKGVAERGKQGARVVPMYFTPPQSATASKLPPDVRESLEMIARGEGAFSRDPLEHATNCIESMKALARQVLEEYPADSSGVTK